MAIPADFRHHPDATILVVVFHGIGAKTERLKSIIQTIEARFGTTADVLMPKRWSGWLSNAHPVAVTHEAVRDVDDLMARFDYQQIIVVGYSAGGLFARKFIIYAHGEQLDQERGHPDAPFEPGAAAFREARPWATKIKRLILLAGMNRGWEFAPTVNPFLLALFRAGYVLFRPFARLGASVRRGAPFVADLRNQWLSLSRRGLLKDLLVVQLLGTIDDVVSPEDNIDTATGSDFIYLDVPGSGHHTICRFDDRLHGPARREKFLLALAGTPEELKKRPAPRRDYAVDAEVEHVLFVIHGIRDHGYWTAHVARHVVAAARNDVKIVTLTPTYGFFAMLPFIIPSTRHAKIRWFMDQYTEALARFPNAKWISYIGHSNGTYLLAGTLRDYYTPHFHRVVFAGSVVRDDFGWKKYIADGRVSAVLNWVASADWVVALFPRFLSRFGADVGGAGWDGFVRHSPTPAEPVNDVEYVDGTHFAALREQYWDDIAEFIIAPSPRLPRPSGKHHWFVGALAAVSPLIWIFLIALIVVPPIGWLSGLWLASLSVGARAFLSFLWLMLMRAILTRL